MEKQKCVEETWQEGHEEKFKGQEDKETKERKKENRKK